MYVMLNRSNEPYSHGCSVPQPTPAWPGPRAVFILSRKFILSKIHTIYDKA